MEVWLPLRSIPEIHDGYMLSSEGRIKTESNTEDKPYSKCYHSSNGYDYQLLVLKTDDMSPKCRLFPIDQLVASTFIDIPNNLKMKRLKVNHIDGDTRNNNVENLEWVEDIEEWRDVEFKDILRGGYQVSNHGRVRKTGSIEQCRYHLNSRGYMVVHLRRNNPSSKGHMYYTTGVHMIVGKMFVAGFNDNMVINHIDGIQINNHWKNLEYVTIRENTQHAVITGLKPAIPTKDLDMVRMLLIKYKRTRIVYEHIDHDRYPYITPNVIAHIKCNKYIRTDKQQNEEFHIGHLTVDEMDMVRDKLIEADSNCRNAFNMIDHDQFPHITLQIVREIKTNKYSSYMKSNKYDLNNLVFKKTPLPCLISDLEIDIIRDSLMINDGSVEMVFNEVYRNIPSVTRYMIYDIKRGKGYKRSNRYDLSKSYRYPFILKEENNNGTKNE